MPAIGFGLTWFGYALGLWGWCKVKGYDAGFGDLVRPSKAFAWPPAVKVPASSPEQSGFGPTGGVAQPSSGGGGGGGSW